LVITIVWVWTRLLICSVPKHCYAKLKQDLLPILIKQLIIAA